MMVNHLPDPGVTITSSPPKSRQASSLLNSPSLLRSQYWFPPWLWQGQRPTWWLRWWWRWCMMIMMVLRASSGDDTGDSIDFLLGCDKATDSPAYVDVIGNNKKKERQTNKQKTTTAISTHRLVHVIRSNGRVETHALTRISQFTLSVIFYCMVFPVFHGAALYVICYYMVWYVIAWYCYSVWHSNNQGFWAHLEQRLLQGWRALGRLCRDTLGLGLDMISCYTFGLWCLILMALVIVTWSFDGIPLERLALQIFPKLLPRFNISILADVFPNSVVVVLLVVIQPHLSGQN